MPDEAAGFDEDSMGWSAMWDLTALREPRPNPGEVAPSEAAQEEPGIEAVDG